MALKESVIAVDTNAAIDFLRNQRRPPQIDRARSLFLPLPVVGELFVGAFGARDRNAETTSVEELLKEWTVLSPDVNTARFYADIRVHRKLNPAFSASLRNDLWIAALCLQHRLPLLTNDRGFELVPGLEVLHW
ncbi:MAG TPA: PIN domain-containing protein [Thermoanaerobaculia bacterium]|nr:PIN domain-containing protein [Thermoanaerobaculia bacterium]